MKFWHTHKWTPISAQELVIVHYTARVIKLDTEEPITEILLKCSICGDVKTKTISGHWTIEEIKNGGT